MKTKIIISTIIAVLISSTGNAQFIKEYTKLADYSVRFAAVIPVENTELSNLYVCGNYGTYLFIGEFSQDGDPFWSRKINLGDTSITINQMIQDSDGNLVIVGTSINGEFGRAFAVKYNPNNKKVVWHQRATTNSFFWDVAELGAGGDYVIGGQETGTGTGNQTDDITAIADRGTGAIAVISSLNKNVNESVEALLYNELTSSIYTTGRYELLSGATKFRICLNKLDTLGAVEWSRSYIENTSTSGRYYSEDILQNADTLIIVGAGDDAGTNSIRYFWLVKTDLDGNALLTNKYDITGTSNDGLFSAIKPHENGYIAYGSLHDGVKFSDIFLFNIDFNGNIVWAKSYPFSTRTPTTGLFNASSMAIVGDNIFQVGEKREADGTLKGVLMKVPISTGEVNQCENDVICIVTSLPDNYDAIVSLSSETTSLVFTNELPKKSKHTFNIADACIGLNKESFSDVQTGLINDEEAGFIANELRAVSTELIAYPNPTNGIVTIANTFFNNSESHVVIINQEGKQIANFICAEKEIKYDFTSVANGVYFIKIFSNPTGATEVVKVIKE